MEQRFILLLAAGAIAGVGAYGQGNRRQATMVGGGDSDRGKCTIEVRVDISSEVEIRGATATLRTLAGQPSEWRRFECTSPMPANPANFRFAGVDGRGRQTLVRAPGNGGPAVIRIDDKDGGSEGYTFDIFWSNGMAGGYQGNRPPDRRYDDGDSRYRPGWRDSDYFRRNGRGFTVEEAVRVCKTAIDAQARRRFRDRDVEFGPTRIDDNPGRQDWVLGTIDVRRRGPDLRFRYSCSVDFGTGRVRSAQIDDRPAGGR
jgi:hypothetical protein